MLAEQKLQKVLRDLNRGRSITLEVEGQPITFSHTGFPGFSSVLTIKTPVYCGENYIPASVRSSLPKGKNRHQFFSIDEEQFEVDMLTEVDYYSLTRHEFDGVVSEFCSEADVWRARLDGKDRNDLIHVRAPR